MGCSGQYSPSSMRTAVAALSAFYNLHLGNAWKLFGLVRSPDRKTLPVVLTRQQVSTLFTVVSEERFRTLFQTIYACGLRVSEAVNLRILDIEADGMVLRVRDAKGGKTRLVRSIRRGLSVNRQLMQHADCGPEPTRRQRLLSGRAAAEAFRSS